LTNSVPFVFLVQVLLTSVLLNCTIYINNLTKFSLNLYSDVAKLLVV